MEQAPTLCGSIRRWVAAVLLAVTGLVAWPGDAIADDPVAEDEGGVLLPTDRGRERQLDRARRLVADNRWTDAAILLDELLADDRDAFSQAGDANATRRSIRAEAVGLVRDFPPAGRDAYDTLFRGRAAKALAEAVAADDVEAIASVARRWFETPSGREAALLAAVTLLESNQPSAASSWLERLAAVPEVRRYEPTLSLMRAAARELAGEPDAASGLLRAARGAARIGGRDFRFSAASADELQGWLSGRRASGHTAREWRQPGGDPARNAICEASGPLLVPRYRVPLTSHPEESRLLDRRRRALAGAGVPAMAAGTPLAVDGLLVVQTALGLLAVDFETGKRKWLQSAFPPSTGAGAAMPGSRARLDRVFDDATSGSLSSDGRLVFAVESHPDALTPALVGDVEIRTGQAGGWRGGNVLTAYDLRNQGAVRWRRPERLAGPIWHLGAPLVVGEKLFVLVEEQDQVRLEVLDAATGSVAWTQPLADRDGDQSTATSAGYARRRAGLSPAFGEGVLVCPLGDGAVVALDVATRSLLWAHSYPRVGDRAAPGAFGGEVAVGGDALVPDGPPADSSPIIAAGRVLLAPADSDELLCLGLRDGTVAWPERPRRSLRIAGVVGGRVICLGRAGVEAIDVATGGRIWQRPYPGAARPSGRGIVTPERFLLPLDTPEVVEIAVADGAERARRPARGQVMPGNLVAYRGEIISRSIDSLDVFHQVGALESRIETAQRDAADDPWATYWRAQMDIEAGDMATGLARLRAAATRRAPPHALADALVHGMRRDFPNAAIAWRTWADEADPAATAPRVVRTAVDRFLKLGDVASAWRACHHLLDDPPAAMPLVSDPTDAGLEVDPDRWLRGRIAELAARADEPLRREIAAAVEAAAAAAAAEPDPSARLRRLQATVARLGAQPEAALASDALVAEIDRRRAAADAVPRALLARRHLLEIARRPTVAAGGQSASGEEWPFGRVAIASGRAAAEPESGLARGPWLGVPIAAVEDGSGINATYDMQHRRLMLSDRYGRRIVDPLAIDVGRPPAAMPWHDQGVSIEPSLVGQLLFVRTTASVTAFDLAADPASPRILWRHVRSPESGVADVRIALPSGRVARDRGIALGRRITEPDDLSARSSAAGVPARASGVLACGQRSVTMLEPATGRVLWERQGLPPALDWVGDDEFLCGCTADGRGSLVLSARDGRLLHVTDVPQRRQRLAVRGRRLFAIVPLDEAPVAARVRIDIVDPVDRDSRPLFECAGESRATLTDDGRLALLEPSGRFTVIDLADGAVVLSAALPDCPPRTEYLHVLPWHDRYLVFAGVGESGLEDTPRGVSALQELAVSGDALPPLSGTLWAVDRRDGGLLWPIPAKVERQCLQTAVPDAVPVVVFSRRTRPGPGHDQPHVSLLCLDKRTGRAVFESSRIAAQPQLAFRCDVVADPEAATVTIGGGGLVRPIVLRWTSSPLPPGPPFQAGSRPPEPGGASGLFTDSLEESASTQVPGP